MINGVVPTFREDAYRSLGGPDYALLGALFHGVVQKLLDHIADILVLEWRLCVGHIGPFVLPDRYAPIGENGCQRGLGARTGGNIAVVLAVLQIEKFIIGEDGKGVLGTLVAGVPINDAPPGDLLGAVPPVSHDRDDAPRLQNIRQVFPVVLGVVDGEADPHSQFSFAFFPALVFRGSGDVQLRSILRDADELVLQLFNINQGGTSFSSEG